MKLSTRGRYGTRLLLDLAMHGGPNPVPLKDIAQRQEVSLRYLEHLVVFLISAGIIRSTRGPKGGVALAKPASEIRLDEVIQILEGSIAPVDCVDDASVCDRSEACAARDVWTELKKAMTRVLESVTLEDLVERQKVKEQSEMAMYYI